MLLQTVWAHSVSLTCRRWVANLGGKAVVFERLHALSKSVSMMLAILSLSYGHQLCR